MNIYIDTEFIEDGKTIELLSIGLIADTGHTLESYYAENGSADWGRANDWVKANVLPHLERRYDVTWKHPAAIAVDIQRWCQQFLNQGHKLVFWGYYADYDWVALCQLFGTMMDLPNGWPTYCRDLKQLCDDLGNPELPKQGKGEHNALADAHWNLTTHLWLTDYASANHPPIGVSAPQQGMRYV